MVPDVDPAVHPRIQRLAMFVTGPLASWVGVAFWLAVVAVAIPFAVKLGSIETSKLTEFLPSGAQSTRALELDQRFPSGRALDAEVVYFRRTGLTAADVAHAQGDKARLSSRLGAAVGPPSGVVLAPDRKVAVVTVPVPGDELAIEHTLTRMRSDPRRRQRRPRDPCHGGGRHSGRPARRVLGSEHPAPGGHGRPGRAPPGGDVSQPRAVGSPHRLCGHRRSAGPGRHLRTGTGRGHRQRPEHGARDRDRLRRRDRLRACCSRRAIARSSGATASTVWP